MLPFLERMVPPAPPAGPLSAMGASGQTRSLDRRPCLEEAQASDMGGLSPDEPVFEGSRR